MKKHIFFGALLLLSGLTSVLRAQDVIGPIDVYVSKQGGNPNPLNAGSYQASADEGRVIQATVSNVQGPITVDPMSFSLTGPPCPTYSKYGRSPATPPPPNTANLDGKVSLNMSQIPEPGSKVNASFDVKDNGYYTKCAKGEQVPYNYTATVKYTIHSIKIALPDKPVTICKGDQFQLKVESLYPETGGTVTWASQNGKVKIVSSDNKGATLSGESGGDDVITATYTVQGATFKATANVKVVNVAFAKEQNIIYWYEGGTKNGKDFLAESSTKEGLVWELSAGAAKIDANTGEITYPKIPGGIYTLTAKIKDPPKDCKTSKATTKVIFLGFRVVMDVKKNPCDGEEANLHLEPLPASVKKSELSGFMPITIKSEPKDKFVGNDGGNTELEFSALDKDFKCKVLNCYWFNTGGCNFLSTWNIVATGTADGHEVKGQGTPTLTVSLTNDCINGFTTVDKTFSGTPVFTTVAVRGGFACSVTGVGTFKRDVKGKITVFKCPPKSQYYKLLKDEEEYHVGQIEGKNGTLCADLWLIENIDAAIKGKVGLGRTPAQAEANMKAIFNAAVTAETLRGTSLFAPPPAGARRCKLEEEAKNATGIKYGYNLKCAYPKCVK